MVDVDDVDAELVELTELVELVGGKTEDDEELGT